MSGAEWFFTHWLPTLLLYGAAMSLKDSPRARRHLKREWRKFRRRLGLLSVEL